MVKEDEEISIDFSKIKNFFKRDKKEGKKADDTPKAHIHDGKEMLVDIKNRG